MKTGMKSLVEKRMAQINSYQSQLIEGWSPFINAVDKYMLKTRDRKMNVHERRTVAQCLQNALDESGLRRSKIFEATQEDDVTFLGIQLPVIAALLPTLVLNDIAIVQALDRRLASVFYFDAMYGSTKGAITAGDPMVSARTGHDRTTAGRRYAMAAVEDEVLTDLVAPAATYTGTVDYAPGVKLGTIVVKDSDGNELGTDEATDGTIADTTDDSSGVSGTITAAGVYELDFSASDIGSGLGATISYHYQYDLPYDEDCCTYKGVPEVDFRVTQDNIEAIDFPVRAKYSVGASIDLLKAHGINLESEVVKYLGGEIKFTIDHYGIDLILDAAVNGIDANTVATLGAAEATVHRNPAAAITSWSADVGAGEPWLWKKHEIMDRFEEGSNNIFAATLRGMANFIIAGNGVARVIKQLPSFKAAAIPKVPTGPMNIGTLDGRIVIQDPFMTSTRYVMGYRGDAFLYAGLGCKTAA